MSGASYISGDMKKYLASGIKVCYISSVRVYRYRYLPREQTAQNFDSHFFSQVLEYGEKIPKRLLKACAGIILYESSEAGLVVSIEEGNGVALAHHKDGSWSNPIAITMTSAGAGLVAGYADKSVIMLLNHFAMDKLLKSQGMLSIGVEAGFALGKTGRAAEAEVDVSKGGLGSSLVYTYSNGAMFSFEVVMGAKVNPPNEPNEKFYGKGVSTADILDGKVEAPEGSLVPVLLQKLTELENRHKAEEKQA